MNGINIITKKHENKKKKTVLKIIIILLITVIAAIAVLIKITPPPPQKPQIKVLPQVDAVSVAIADGNTGKFLGGKDSELRVYPASTTKILTCIIALEEGHDKLNDNALITPNATKQDGTCLGLNPDLPISLQELLYGMMLVSGNDAAVSVAETVSGDYETFIKLMNAKAKNIGAVNSNFVNANGLTDKNHYTTASDMAKIAVYAMKNQNFRKIVKEPFYMMTYRDGTIRRIENRNEFLESGYEGANGIKTGMTEAAGDCLVASAERDGHLVVVSIYNDENRWEDVKKLLDYGFDAIKNEEMYEKAMREEPFVYKVVNRIMGNE